MIKREPSHACKTMLTQMKIEPSYVGRAMLVNIAIECLPDSAPTAIQSGDRVQWER